MEHPPLRQLHWSDRDLQTTLPAETARALCPKQSAATGIQFRLSLELQGKQFDGDSTPLTLKRSKAQVGRASERPGDLSHCQNLRNHEWGKTSPGQSVGQRGGFISRCGRTTMSCPAVLPQRCRK